MEPDGRYYLSFACEHEAQPLPASDRELGGAPRETLAARLRTLVGAGILERRQYSDHPARFEYYLSDVGKDLYPVILTLRQWGDRHLAGADGPPTVFTHRCGHPLTARLVCESCGEPVVAGHSRPAAAG